MVFRSARAASRVMGIVLVLCAVTVAAAGQPPPELDNGQVRVAFDPATGSLAALSDARTGHEFLEAAQPRGIWQMDAMPPAPKGVIAPEDARAFRWAYVDDERTALELVWDDFGFADAPELRVRVEVSLDTQEPTAYWRFAAEGLGGLRLSAVRFPRVEGIAPQEEEVLAVPIWMGQAMARPRALLCEGESPRRLSWESPGLLSMQCLALYRRDGPGLYVAADDVTRLGKRFSAYGAPDRAAGLEIIHLPENTAEQTGRYEPPYRSVLGVFEGDWFTVAERYRRWALEQPWSAASRLATGAVPDWVEQTGLWVWNRGRSDGVLPPAVALQERAGMPVSVFWHWWHGCSYDTGFPEYLPPREGAEPFAAALARAQDAGVHAIVYMNQRLWSMTTESWVAEGAEAYAVKGLDGTVRPEIYNTFTKAPNASMCMGTSFWRDTYAGLAEQAVTGLGVNGIYMDQACSSLACYDASHGHPLGGGRYWMDGFRALQADIRERCGAARPVALAGEGCGEAWLPYLDLMLSLQVSMERYAAPDVWEPIPFFHAVYHGHAVFFGNYSSLTMPPYDDLWPAEFAPEEPLKLLDRRFSQQFRLEQARAFVWGQQPTIANFLPEHFESRAEELDYVVRLARLRMQALKYLLHGTMLRPPAVDVPDDEIDVSRLSIYAGQQEALKEYRKRMPAVLASAWRAPDGDVCVAAVNVTDRPQRLTIDLDPAAYPIPEDYRASQTGSDAAVPVGRTADGTVSIHVELDGAGARIYEFVRP